MLYIPFWGEIDFIIVLGSLIFCKGRTCCHLLRLGLKTNQIERCSYIAIYKYYLLLRMLR